MAMLSLRVRKLTLHTAAPKLQGIYVGVNAALPHQLVAAQVSCISQVSLYYLSPVHTHVLCDDAIQ